MMFWRILGKDLKRKRGSNTILLIMVILASLFLSGGAAMMIATGSSIEHFLDESKVADYYFISHADQITDIESFLENSSLVDSFTKSEYIQPGNESIKKNGEKIDTGLLFFSFSVPSTDGTQVYDQNDKLVTSMKKGEFAMSIQKAEKLGFTIGDEIEVKIGDKTIHLKMTTLLKDSVMGSEYMSVSRFIINGDDYKSLAAQTIPGMKMIFWGVKTDNVTEFSKALSKSNLMFAVEFSRDTVASMYTMEKMSAVMYAIIAIVLIFIALTLLRFTICFTIEEDYREIGVMKAIGLKPSGIRNIYVVKYLAIAVVGSVIGLISSFPMTNYLISSLGKYMVLPTGNSDILQRMICAAAVILIILFFCHRATRKITKMSAVEAIREGSSGERFSRKGFIKLKGSSSKPTTFMAKNDILSNLRSYLSVFLALSAGICMIILPANAAATLRHGDTLQYFGFPLSDMYADVPHSLYGVNSLTYEELEKALDDIEADFTRCGFEVKASAQAQMSAKIYAGADADAGFSVSGYNPLRDEIVKLPYIKGSAPRLANEIGVSDIVLKKLGSNLGDTVTLRFGPEERKVIITGIMQSMSNGGDSIFLPYKLQAPLAYSAGVGVVTIDFVYSDNVADRIALAKAKLPVYHLKTTREYETSLMESTITTIDGMVNLFTVVAAIINLLVVFLIGSALLQKDKPSIALLKSIGFSDRSLKKWQILRIMIVSVLATLFGVGLSYVLNGYVTKLNFGMMGADSVPAHPNLRNVLVRYPTIMVCCALVSSFAATAGIKKISMSNIGNLE